MGESCDALEKVRQLCERVMKDKSLGHDNDYYTGRRNFAGSLLTLINTTEAREEIERQQAEHGGVTTIDWRL